MISEAKRVSSGFWNLILPIQGLIQMLRVKGCKKIASIKPVSRISIQMIISIVPWVMKGFGSRELPYFVPCTGAKPLDVALSFKVWCTQWPSVVNIPDGLSIPQCLSHAPVFHKHQASCQVVEGKVSTALPFRNHLPMMYRPKSVCLKSPYFRRLIDIAVLPWLFFVPVAVSRNLHPSNSSNKSTSFALVSHNQPLCCTGNWLPIKWLLQSMQLDNHNMLIMTTSE